MGKETKHYADALAAGTTLQGGEYRYRIERALGQGSFGITYLAATRVKVSGALGELEADMKVAVKEFFMKDVNGREESTVTSGSKDGLFADYKRKFRREAENLSRLRHPHIVRVLETFEANGTAYYAMEYCEGGCLNELADKRGGLPEEEAVGYAVQIGEALAYMHAHKMLHLDVKPGNAMLRGDGSVALIDFGLSKQYGEDGEPESSTSVGGGTPGYAPLEQAQYREGRDFPVTMDVYALGATLFKLLTGERPPEASAVLNDGFPAGALRQRKVSEATIAIAEKAMAPLRKDRYPSVNAMLAALKGGAAPDDEETEVDEKNKKPDEKPQDTKKQEEKKPPVAGTEDKKSDDESGVVKKLEKKKPAGRRKVLIAAAAATALLVALLIWDLLIAPDKVGYMGEGLIALLIWDLLIAAAAATALLVALLIWDQNKRTATKVYQYNQGEEFYHDEDYAKAVKWYRKAAELGYDKAQYSLGYCYYSGKGVAHDYVEAMKWYRKAARQGHVNAQYMLGVCYYNGQGVTQDYDEAVKWWRKAAEQRHDMAQNNLGRCYLNGWGVADDDVEAVKWFQKAAEQKYATAQYNLGLCYENGWGVARDNSEAARWYRKAAEQGYTNAKKALERLER